MPCGKAEGCLQVPLDVNTDVLIAADQPNTSELGRVSVHRICQRNVAFVLNQVRDLIATLLAYLPSTSPRAVLSRRCLVRAEHPRSPVSPSQRRAPSCGLLLDGRCWLEVQTAQQLLLDCCTRELPPSAVTQTCKVVSSSGCDPLAGWLQC